MPARIDIAALGAPSVLTLTAEATAPPAPGQVQLRQTAIGVNYVDVYHRTGIYALPEGPQVPGVEAVGLVEAVGADVEGFSPGDRVCYCGFPAGSYRELRNVDAARLLPVPAGVDDDAIAGSLLRGLTAHLLLRRIRPIGPGDTVLIHAAAGGLGLILARWAKTLGATTIGTVGSAEKADLAASFGLEHAILHRDQDFVTVVERLTGGRGVDLAIDGVGGDNFARTLKTLKPFGIAAAIGQTAGPVPPVDVAAVTNRFVSRPSILAHIADVAAYRAAAEDWLALLSDGFRLHPGHSYAFRDAPAAHADLESGRTTGPVRLVF